MDRKPSPIYLYVNKRTSQKSVDEYYGAGENRAARSRRASSIRAENRPGDSNGKSDGGKRRKGKTDQIFVDAEI